MNKKEVQKMTKTILDTFRIFQDDELTIEDIIIAQNGNKEYSPTQVLRTINNLKRLGSLVKTCGARGKSGVSKWKLARKHRARLQTYKTHNLKPETKKVTTVEKPKRTSVVKRLTRIEVLNAIKSMGPITTAELADNFNVTNNVIRRYITELHNDEWTLTTTPTNDNTPSMLYSYGGKIVNKHHNDLVKRCYHLTMAFGKCTIKDVINTFSIDEQKAKEVIILTAKRCNMCYEITLYSD